MHDWEAFVGDRIYLDSNIFIYAVETGNKWTKNLTELFEAIDDRAIMVSTSEITIAEVLTKPIAVNDAKLVAIYTKLLRQKGLIEVIPVDRSVLHLAAHIRARRNIKLIDAIHVASAKVATSDFFLTHDVRLGLAIKDEVRWLPLDDDPRARS